MTVARIAALPDGQVIADEQDIEFALDLENGRRLEFVANFGVASQITAALGGMLRTLHQQLGAKNDAPVLTSAENVAESYIQKDQWSETVILRLTTPAGVPYAFALSSKFALDIAAQLKSEASKPTEVGRA